MRRCFNKMSFASRKLISNFRKKPKNLGAKEPSSWQYFFRFRPSPFRETAAFPAAQLIFKNFCQNLKFHLFFTAQKCVTLYGKSTWKRCTYLCMESTRKAEQWRHKSISRDRSEHVNHPTYLPTYKHPF